MYYLSAQPDALFFKWQIEVQLFNFKKNGIPPEKIHVLIGYPSVKGINPKFIELANEQKDNARFFFYSDDRVTHHYTPAIRPHIIKKHFLECPYLKDECIFYHDSDIIFRKLPDFERLCAGNTWYVSDTRSYLDAEYIKTIGGTIFYEMCELMGVDKRLIIENDENAGGAQYVMKGVNYQFWDKIEHDCERLYKFLNDNHERYAAIFCKTVGIHRSEYHGLQSWCADMWAIFWNALNLGYKVKIDKELDFCWPQDTLDKWEATKILHNAGVGDTMSEQYFFKGHFHNNDPYEMNFDTILTDRCTIKYVENIQQFRDTRKKDLLNVTIIIIVNNKLGDQVNDLYTTLNFIDRHFKTKVLLAEVGTEPVLEDARLPPCVKKVFFSDSGYFHKTRYNNIMISKADTAIISLYDADVVFDPEQIESAVYKIQSGECAISYPYHGEIVGAWDPALKRLFASKLDTRIFLRAFSIESNKNFGGAVFINRHIYIQCGMDNEFIPSGEMGDLERLKRMEILGFKYVRIGGTLYHLSYNRELNYKSHAAACLPSLDEYLRICKMSKEELSNEIANWKWSNALPQSAC